MAGTGMLRGRGAEGLRLSASQPLILLTLLALSSSALSLNPLAFLNKGGCPELKEVESKFKLDKPKLTEIKNEMLRQMEMGLNTNPSAPSPLLMLPTHLTKIPTGEEVGEFMALDIGGTNFRVLKVKLQGKGQYSVDQGKYRIDESLMYSPGDKLFTFIAEKVKEFAPESAECEEPIALGFTFSFPVEQSSIDVGTLVKWTKGFSCPGVEGKDVVALLQTALKEVGVNAKVVALINDTPGTMLAGAYTDPNVAAGLILGTGTNLCYAESVQSSPKLQVAKPFTKLPSCVTWNNAPYAGPGMVHLVNTEWGGFDSGEVVQVLPLSAYDVVLDRKSVNPGEHLYEKMISGMFLGEICRLIASDLIAKGKLFRGNPSQAFIDENGFTTETMANIEASDLGKVEEILKKMELKDVSKKDCQLMKEICTIVSTRAARLTGAGLAALAQKLNKISDCLIAVDGTVFAKYPKFQDKMNAALKEILGTNGIRFMSASDGSGVGAALAAAALTT